MNLSKVANKAATDASKALGASLSARELKKVTTIIAKAMENAVLESSDQHASVCDDCLDHDRGLAHKIQKELELKKVALISNLSSLR